MRNNPQIVRKDIPELQKRLLHYGPWRLDQDLPGDFLSLQTISLPKEEKEKIMSFGKEWMKFLKASDQLYCESSEVRQLLAIGKPKWWLEVAEQLQSRKSRQLPLFYRPDMVLTESGLKTTEVEMAVEGQGFQTVWSQSYDAPPQVLENIVKRLGSKTFYVMDLSQQIPESSITVSWLREHDIHARLLSLQNEAPVKNGSNSVLFRPFNLARWTEDRCFCTGRAIDLSLREDLLLLNPTSWFEEKIWLGLLWHPTLGEFFREKLGCSSFNFLRNITSETWILHPDFIAPETVKQWKSLSGEEKRFVSKLSGFNLKAWGSRSVVLWDQQEDKEWQEFLDRQMEDPKKQRIYVIQKYYHPVKTLIWVANLREHIWQENPLIERKGLKTQVSSFYWGEDFIGTLARLRNNRLIHGASDTVLVPVDL